MGTIFYSMAGEGRGHATRARTIIEDLRRDHRIVIYAPAHAYDLLYPLYRGSEVEVRNIPGLTWTYTKRKKLNYVSSFFNAMGYVTESPALVKRLAGDIERETPDLIITDFDPALPRAAKKVGVPFVSFDHQHFITTYDLSSLPPYLKLRAAFMAPSISMFYTGQIETIVSSFYFPPLKKKYSHVRQIGVLLNREVTGAVRRVGGHIVVYVRRFGADNLIEALRNCGCEVRIYGLGARLSSGNLKFNEIGFYRFMEDLASSRALVCTAGNQVVGEALYLEKPVLAIPETGNFEQEINGHFLEETGAGISAEMDQVTPELLRHFLDLSDYYRERIDPERVHGNPEALRIINSHIRSGAGSIIPEHDLERAVS